MRTALVLLALATLAGCSTKYDLTGSEWVKSGTGVLIQDVTYDEMECVRDAREAGHTPDLIVGGLVDIGRYFFEEHQRNSAFQRCMESKVYRRSGS
jgi:hypothetical protein